MGFSLRKSFKVGKNSTYMWVKVFYDLLNILVLRKYLVF